MTDPLLHAKLPHWLGPTPDHAIHHLLKEMELAEKASANSAREQTKAYIDAAPDSKEETLANERRCIMCGCHQAYQIIVRKLREITGDSE